MWVGVPPLSTLLPSYDVAQVKIQLAVRCGKVGDPHFRQKLIVPRLIFQRFLFNDHLLLVSPCSPSSSRMSAKRACHTRVVDLPVVAAADPRVLPS